MLHACCVVHPTKKSGVAGRVDERVAEIDADHVIEEQRELEART